MANNDTANVSASKGIKGGYLYSAPVGTPLPTTVVTSAAELDSAFNNIGFIGPDGYQLSEESEAVDFNDAFGESMDEGYSSRTESAQFTPAEVKAAGLKAQYGESNVTDKDGVITVLHNSDNHPEYSYVGLFQLKNGRLWTHVVPRGKSSELDTLTISSSELAARALTIKYMTDENGQTCYDYIQSTETTAGKAAKS